VRSPVEVVVVSGYRVRRTCYVTSHIFIIEILLCIMSSFISFDFLQNDLFCFPSRFPLLLSNSSYSH
jgi:hypothetical protein